VLISPLLIGGAPAGIQVALAMGMLLATVAWAVSRRGELRPAPFLAAAGLAVAWTLFQLLPLPGGLVELLSPHTLDVRSDAAGHRPAFVPLSLDVPATILAALRAFCFLAILLVTAKTIRWRGRTMQLAVPLALGGGVLALLSFAQRWLGAGSILGLYTIKEMPGSGFFGTFVNGNHAASFFSLTALLAIGCLRETEIGRLRLAVGLSAALSALAVISTGSRTGLLGLAAGLGALLSCLLVARLGPKRGLLAAAALATVSAPLLVIASIAQRRALSEGWLDALLADQKLRGWQTALALARNYPWTGVGRGAFEGPAALFRPDHEGVRLVFPENLLLQLLSEWGIPLTLAVLVLCVRPALQMARRLPTWEPVFQGAACGVVAVLVHEFADFGLELPGVAFPVAMALGLCAGRLQMSDPGSSDTGRVFSWPLAAAGLASWLGLVMAGAWAAPRTSEVEGVTAQRLSNERSAEAAAALRAIVQRHPAEAYFELLAAKQAMNRRDPEALRHLNRALRLFPRAASAHVLAFYYLAAAGRRQQAAMEYRLAVELGYPFNYVEVAAKVGPENVARAVRQRPQDLLDLASSFTQSGRHKDADVASARAVELAEGAESARIRRLEIALASKEKTFMAKAGVELARTAATPKGFELGAQGLALAGDVTGARTVLGQGLKANPDDTGMTARAARVLLAAGDLEGARDLLAGWRTNQLPLTDRIAIEQVSAEIAEKQGVPETAAAARARVRILERLQAPREP
jgi:Flp pilus assembly protein TadD